MQNQPELEASQLNKSYFISKKNNGYINGTNIKTEIQLLKKKNNEIPPIGPAAHTSPLINLDEKVVYWYNGLKASRMVHPSLTRSQLYKILKHFNIMKEDKSLNNLVIHKGLFRYVVNDFYSPSGKVIFKDVPRIKFSIEGIAYCKKLYDLY